MPRWSRASFGIQVAFALMFAVIALTILMASVLIGLNFANRLVAPIRRLMNAANVVSTGDLHVQVPCSGRKAISPNSAKPSTR